MDKEIEISYDADELMNIYLKNINSLLPEERTEFTKEFITQIMEMYELPNLLLDTDELDIKRRLN